MIVCCRRLVTAIIILLVTLTVRSVAQESDGRAPTDHHQVLSVNPFGLILLPWYNGEYERKVAERVTLGVSGSRLPWGDGGGFYSFNTALRYYVNGRTFRGFYLGPRFGLFWVSQEPGLMYDEGDLGPHLGLGFELGYAWLLGPERHLSLSIGGGATRVLNGTGIPVARLLNVGWAF